jgi:hypothetical protein
MFLFLKMAFDALFNGFKHFENHQDFFNKYACLSILPLTMIFYSLKNPNSNTNGCNFSDKTL